MPEPEAGEQGRVQTVSELNRRIKDLLERGVAPCWVRGEVSNLRRQSSGHCYFSLKDEASQLTAVLFRGDAARLSLQLRDGQQVLAFGQISLYEARGQYQLIVRVMLEDGLGRLQQKFEQLKQRLSAEGLFDSDRKRPLPEIPQVVGFVTSPTGAAVRDFIRILQRRHWRGRLIILPVRVQGEGAAEEMVEMLALAGRLKTYTAEGDEPGCGERPFLEGAPQPESLGDLQSTLFPVTEKYFFDLLVIGRGGGSLEDLWAFNNERLVRAVADSPIPVISAVGHEIDFTLSDFAADCRAETPSAAAELISSGFLKCLERVEKASLELLRSTRGFVERAGERTAHAASRLRLLSPRGVLEQHQLRLDDLANRMAACLSHELHSRRHSLAETRARLLRHSPEHRFALVAARLQGLSKRLAAASAQSVLKRGFVVVRDETGKPVVRAEGIAPGTRLRNQFQDGELPVEVTAEVLRSRKKK